MENPPPPERDEVVDREDERERGERRLAALRRIGDAVDAAGLYDRTFIP